jgi:hypothetical protein
MYAMLDSIIGSLLLTCLSGFLFAAVGTGMAADMESSVLAGFPGTVIGILAGAVGAIRLAAVELPLLCVICVVCGAVGAAAACLSTILGNPLAVYLAGICFGLLGGLLVVPMSLFGLFGGLLTGAIGGSLFGLLIARRRHLQDRGQR